MLVRNAAVRYALVVGLAFLTAVPAFALEAVIEVNEDPWYTEFKESRYGGASLTAFYAPLPVFFEGWQSAPRASIQEYRWDFGDGTATATGFNAAHVYEVPGTYTATLTISDGTATDTMSYVVEVWPRDGTTYYVDAELGSDSNPGTAPGAGSWRTASHVFRGVEESRYRPGDQVLFKRGQVFEIQAGQCAPGHGKAKYGYMFGAHGDPGQPKPILQYTSGGGNLMTLTGNGLAHFSMVDLHFKLQNQSGQRPGELLFSTQDINQILFLRLDIEHFTRAITFSQGIAENRGSGVFLVDNTLHDSHKTQIFMRVSRLALLGNSFDYSGNHIAYLNYVDKGIINGNVFSRPAFGRAAMRLDGDGGDTNNVVVSDNLMQGWVDPRTDGREFADGERYNWNLVSLAPNGPWFQRMHDVVFERNVVANAERLLMVADYDNLTIRNNLFTSSDRAEGPSIRFGYSNWEKKPIRNLRFVGNTVVVRGAGQADSLHSAIGVYDYVGPSFEGANQHTGIEISDNIVQIYDKKRRAVFVESGSASLLNNLTVDHNLYYVPNNPESAFQIGTIHNGGATSYSLAGWRERTGFDANSLHADPHLADLEGPDGVFSGVWFDEDLRPLGTSPAIDGGSDHVALHADHLGSPRPHGGLPDIGAFEQPAAIRVAVVGQGSATIDPNRDIELGDTVTLTATPESGWEFTGWSGDVESTDNPLNVTLYNYTSVVATFADSNPPPPPSDNVTLDLDIDGSGFVSLTPAPPYQRGDEVTLTATALNGFVFEGWIGDYVSSEGAVTFVLDENTFVTALFVRAAEQDDDSDPPATGPTLTLLTEGEGAVLVDDAGPYAVGDEVNMLAVPAEGWRFLAWSDDAGNATQRSITLSEDTELTALFVPLDLLPEDVNQDLVVNIHDLQLIVNAVLDLDDEKFVTDLNGDGETNIVDLHIVVDRILSQT
jgi:PKD repeat protein